MASITATKINETYYMIDADDGDILYAIDNHFSVMEDGAQFSTAFKLKRWDGKKHFFNPRSRMMPIGLTEELVEFCKKRRYDLKFKNVPDVVDWITLDELHELEKKYMAGSGITPRDYQEAAVMAALNQRRGILECCTSSGKSLMIYLIIRTLMEKKDLKHILLVVPSIMLVTQMYKDFESYGWTDLADFVEQQDKDHIPTFNKPVLITTWQSLTKQDVLFFEKQQCIICDEAHSSRGNILNSIVKFCSEATFRIGTTGTLPTSLADKFSVKSVLGKTLYKITSRELIDRGYLTEIVIANMFLQYPMDFILSNQERSYPEEVRMVEEYEDRKTILKTIMDHSPKDHNTLILCNHVDHVDATVEYLKEIAPDREIKKITGSVKSAEREFIRVSAEETDGMVIVATFGTMSTGVNIKKIHQIILYANSRSKIKVLQSLGRGLRKHPDKKKIIIYDIVDDLRWKSVRGKVHTNYLYEHWLERSKYYIEQEFSQKSATIRLYQEAPKTEVSEQKKKFLK